MCLRITSGDLVDLRFILRRLLLRLVPVLTVIYEDIAAVTCTQYYMDIH